MMGQGQARRGGEEGLDEGARMGGKGVRTRMRWTRTRIMARFDQQRDGHSLNVERGQNNGEEEDQGKGRE